MDDHSFSCLYSRQDACVAMFVPRADFDLAPLDRSWRHFHEGNVRIAVEDQRLLRNHQHGAGIGNYLHARQHLRFQLEVRILYLASNLCGVCIRIDVGTDALDLALEHFVGKGGGYRVQVLADAYPREINFVDIRGQPDVIQRSELV